MMKKLIKNSVLFILLVLVVYPCLLLIWAKFAPLSLKQNIFYVPGAMGHIHTKLKEVKSTSDIDILFLGSSHAYRGFDPRVYDSLGYSNFNLGSSAQTPLQTELLLNRYLDSLRPDIVVYEVYPETFALDGIESTLYLLANDTLGKDLFELTTHYNHVKVYNVLCYAYYQELMGATNEFVEDIRKEDDTYIKDGFVEKDFECFEYKTYETQNREFREDQLESFDRIYKMLAARDIEINLVQAPYTSSLYQSYNNNATFDSIMNTYGEYHNFNGRLNLDDSLHFYDKDHMNKYGVKIFNEAMVKLFLK